MICKNCHDEVPQEALFCPNCGALIENNSSNNGINDDSNNKNRYDSNQYNKFNYDEFFVKFASKKTRNYVKALGIICIVTAVISLCSFVVYPNPLFVIDFIFYVIFGSLILKVKRLAVIVPVCIYGGLFTIIGIILTGVPTGIFAFIIGIFTALQLKKFNDAFKNFKLKNQIPSEEHCI